MSKVERYNRVKSKHLYFPYLQEKNFYYNGNNNYIFEKVQKDYTHPNSYYPKKTFSKQKKKYSQTQFSNNDFYQTNYNHKRNFQNYYFNEPYHYNSDSKKYKGNFNRYNKTLKNFNYNNEYQEIFDLNDNQLNDNKEENNEEINKKEKQKFEVEKEKNNTVNININNIKIVNYYFLTSNEKENFHIFSNEYISQFQNWKSSNETKLLNNDIINHINLMKDFISEYPKEKDKKYYNLNININNFQKENLEKWGRKDITNEIKLAEIYKEQLDKLKLKDPIKFDLIELLNMLTVDNYEETKNSIFNIISKDINYQEKFLDVLLQKAVNEKAFVNLYAKLCKELDDILPQRTEKINNSKKVPSIMRTKLLDKCREIFKIDNNNQFNDYIKESDPSEREEKLKKFILGNVNFIGELIKNQILSRKNILGCINNLFKRYEKEGGDKLLKLFNLEGIVILIDKLGTLLKNQKGKIKENELKEFENKIDNYINKLNFIQSNEKLPGHIKYKIINLIEKKKSNWEETQYEKNIHAKGKKEIRKEYEKSIKENSKFSQEDINEQIRLDLLTWKESIENEEEKDYKWEIITDLYNNHCNLSQFLEAFIENSIDFVSNEKNLNYANKYISDLLYFYSDKISKEEKKDLTNKTLNLLSRIYDYSLDNKLIIDIFSNVLFQLSTNCLMSYDKIGTLNDLNNDNIKQLFLAFRKIAEIDNMEFVTAIFKSFKFVKDNFNEFNNIYFE